MVLFSNLNARDGVSVKIILFNSSEIDHRDRWSITIPPLDALLEYNARVMQKTRELLAKSIDAEKAYFIQLAMLKVAKYI
jgi:hypothetical protein